MASVKIALGIGPLDPYEKSFEIAKSAGFDGVDFLPANKHFFFPPHEIAVYSKKYALPVTGMHSPLYLVPYAPQFLFPRLLSITKYFPEVKTYVVHMSMVLNYLQNNTEKITKLTSLAKDRGVTVCFESNPIFFPLQYYPKQTYVPDIYGQYCVKHTLSMTFDTSHIASVGGDIVDFYKKYHSHIKMLHVSDFKDGIEHLPLGKGSLPLRKLFEEMRKTKHDHYIVFEIGFSRRKSTKERIKELTESVSFMKSFWEK